MGSSRALRRQNRGPFLKQALRQFLQFGCTNLLLQLVQNPEGIPA